MVFKISPGAKYSFQLLPYLVLSLCFFPLVVSATTIQYSYDANQRLTQIDYGNGGKVTYSYDQTGNRLTETTAAAIIVSYEDGEDGNTLGWDIYDSDPAGATIGNVFDLVGKRTQTDYKQISDKVVEETYQVELRNQKETDDVTVRVVEHLSRGGNWEIITASPETWKKTDSNTIEWNLPVPAQDKATITYTVRYTW